MTKSLDENIEKLNAYVEYCKYYKNINKYCNTFEIANIKENSHTNFLAWLLDITDSDSDDLKKFKQEFIDEFIDKIKFYEMKNKKIIVETQHNHMDIFIHTEDETCALVIENKICANINVTKQNGQNSYITQVEKYYKDNDLKKYNNKKFIFLCAYSDICNKKLKEKVSTRGENWKKIQIDGTRINDDTTVKYLLEKFEYDVFEHSDIALILYKILKKTETNKMFYNGILEPICKKDLIIETLKMITDNCMVDNDENKCNIKNLINQLEKLPENKSISLNYIRNNCKFKKKKSPKVILFCNITNIGKNAIFNLFSQYIEYFENHIDKTEGFYGYTKIINGKYLWDICKDIKNENSEEWKNVETIASELEQEKCNDLKHIVNELNKKD